MSQREIPSPTQRGTTNCMRMGEALYPGESLVSTNGLFTLTLSYNPCKINLDQKDVTTLWSEGKDGFESKMFLFQGDGNLVLYERRGWTSWGTGTNGKCNADSVLTLSDNGNIFITTDNTVIWTTDVAKNIVPVFQELRVGQKFTRGQILESKSKECRFRIENDGRAVCSRGKKPYWVFPSNPKLPELMVLQVLDTDEMNFGDWWSRTHYRKSGGKAVLTLRDDGDLVLESEGKIIWCGNNPAIVQPTFPVDFSRTADDQSTLQPGTYMSRGQALLSSNGKWTAKFEADGKFILYRKYFRNEDPSQPRLEKVLTVKISDKGAHYIYMQLDQRLTCYGASAEILWEVKDFNDTHKGILTLANDGLLTCGSQLDTGVRYPASARPGLNMLRPYERISLHDYLTSDDGVYTARLERGTYLSVYKRGKQSFTRNLDGGTPDTTWTLPDTNETDPATGHRALTIDDSGCAIIFGPDFQEILRLWPLRGDYGDNYWLKQREKSGWKGLPDSPRRERLVIEYDGTVRIWTFMDEELRDLKVNDRIRKDPKYVLGDTRIRSSPFKAVYNQGEPVRSESGYGIGGYNMQLPNDQLFAYDFDSSGLLDHIVLYNPGNGAFWVAKHEGTTKQWKPVYAQGYGGDGVGGYDLKSPNDRALAFDWDSSGKQDHILLYRPGHGNCWVLRRQGTNGFHPVYSRSGLGNYDLSDPLDQVFAFDYQHTGKLDHLCAYRPGKGAFYIFKREGDQFVGVYASWAGIGGYDVKSVDDRAFAFDWNSDGKMDHICLYRPGGGVCWIIRNDGGNFRDVYQGTDTGVAWYDLKQKFDEAFAFDWNKSGKKDHIVFYRPSWGTFWCLRRNGNDFEIARNNLQVGLGGYDLLSLQDRMFALDFEHNGLQDHLVLYRSNGTGTVWILDHAFE